MEQQLTTARYLSEIVSVPEPGRRPRTWCGMLTAICALFMLISLASALSSAYGFYRLGPGAETATEKGRPKFGRATELEKMQAEAREKFMPLLVGQEFAKLGFSAAFFAAVAMLVLRKPGARKVVLGVCGAAILYHVVSVGMSLLMISHYGGALNSVFDDIIASARTEGMSREQVAAAKTSLQNHAATGLAIGLSIALLVKIGFYGGIMAWFWSDDVRRMLDAGTAVPARPKSSGPAVAGLAAAAAPVQARSR
jgi:hypothetical protein